MCIFAVSALKYPCHCDPRPIKTLYPILLISVFSSVSLGFQYRFLVATANSCDQLKKYFFLRLYLTKMT